MISNHLLHLMYQLEITLNSTFTTYQFWITIYLHLVSFHATKCFWKALSSGKCLLKKLLKLNRGCLGSWSHIFLKLIFSWQNKIFKGKSSSEWFYAKNVAESNVPWFSWPGQVTRFNPKILNVFWTWLEVKEGICSIGFQISKFYFFQMALKTCEMWFKWH